MTEERRCPAASPARAVTLFLLVLFASGALSQAAPRQRADAPSDRTIVVLFGDGRGQRQVAVRTLDGDTEALAAGDLAEILQATSYWRSETRKLLFRVEEHRLTLSADNTFIILDNQVRRLPSPPRFLAGQLWVPIAVFDLLAAEHVVPGVWNAERRELVLGSGQAAMAPRPGDFRAAPLTPAPGSETSPSAAELRRGLVALDPGHGGEDAGTRSPGGLIEKHITLELATRVRRHLERDGWFKVVLVRERDEGVPVPRRVEIANSAGADLLVSLHMDLVVEPSPSRFRLSVRPGSSRVVYEDLKPFVAGAVAASEVLPTASFRRWESAGAERGVESYVFAQIVAKELEGRHSGESAAVRRRPLWTLEGATMPAVLVEIAPSRGASGESLTRGEALEDLAAALASGIRSYWLGTGAGKPAPARTRSNAEPHGVER
jgi:N-acetylmuramoyl-L-alanine amidase